MKVYHYIKIIGFFLGFLFISYPFEGWSRSRTNTSEFKNQFNVNNKQVSQITLSTDNPKSKKKPNVILIMTDDQGYGDIGATGSPYVKTPSLDALYQESSRFTNFHTDPSCSPTRAALLTGQYAARSGVWHTIGGRYMLNQQKTTMADVFKFNNYKTGIFGKWHLGQSYPFRPQDRGFEESVVTIGGGVGQSSDYWGNDYFDDTYLHNGKPQKYEGYCDKVWFDEAISFINKNKDEPFFCYLATNIPHAPNRVDEKYAAPYKALGNISDRIANYYGMIAEFDEELGRLLAELKTLKLDQNTIIVFMSDNGPCPWFGGVKIDNEGFLVEGYSAGMRGGKIWGYDNSHRVPCFIRWPEGKIESGKDVDNLSSHFDLLPTFIDACQLKNPSTEKLDGISLLPLLKGEEKPWPSRNIIIQNQRVDFPVKYKEYQVLTDKWRLVNEYQKELEDMEAFNKGLKASSPPSYINDKDRYELYDIKKDPGQKNNLANQFPNVVKNLNSVYDLWWNDVSKDFSKYNNIIIGSAKANPTYFDGEEAHRKGSLQVWAIEVEKEGRYKIDISRWPKEANKKLSENKEGKVAFMLEKATLQVGNVMKESTVKSESMATTFYIDLKAGKTSLLAFFNTNAITNKKINAEFVYVERTGKANPDKLMTYQTVNPDNFLK